ncbi:MAG: hypothetical protein WCH76_08145 [Candidatus Riflemargulisbacteria bacterium]
MPVTIQEKIDSLLNKIDGSRESIEKYVTELEGLKGNLGDMFPKDINYRNKFMMDEKLKIFSEYFSTLLRLRQEVHKLTFEEIKIRNGLNKKDEEEEVTDIRSLAKQIEKINKGEIENGK